MTIRLLHGKSEIRLRELGDASVDAVVTDPPYELGFMGKGWDKSGIANSVELWREVLRVLKPGGHVLAFGGTRTYHRMVCAIEDAGFEIRDQIGWVYASGYPKSLDVSKAIDKAAGVAREGTGEMVRGGNRAARGGDELVGSDPVEEEKWKEVTLPTTPEAKEWDGWGTALKPAWEPIVLARRPIIGTVAENVLAHRTGALNIGESRIPVMDAAYARNCSGDRGHSDNRKRASEFHMTAGSASKAGRWPPNLIHDGSEEVLQHFPEEAGAAAPVRTRNGEEFRNTFGAFKGNIDENGSTFQGDSGSAARFFYCAKPGRSERDIGNVRNTHPTVKPIDLMRYLCVLVTPPKGLVLDRFAGSGTTAIACQRLGFSFIGIEDEKESIDIAIARIRGDASLFSELVVE